MGLPSRYRLSNMAKVVRDPTLLRFEARRLGLAVNAAYTRFRQPADVCNVPNEDWDTLVILDGCRYDLFESENTIEGRLESRTSVGSESWEFLRENFHGQRLHDTVYVTANPHASKLDDGTFHRTVNVLGDRWDEDLRTVRPEAMTEEALTAHDRYPNKRLIVHYMQPHFPFIGETGQAIAHTGLEGGEGEGDDGEHVWYGLRDGDLDIDEATVYEAYRENLELTLPHVSELLDAVDGKSVVTADHGNLVGERTKPLPAKGYGHPKGFYAAGLVNVPWLVVDSAERRNVTADPPVAGRDVDQATVESRLADLGYK